MSKYKVILPLMVLLSMTINAQKKIIYYPTDTNFIEFKQKYLHNYREDTMIIKNIDRLEDGIYEIRYRQKPRLVMKVFTICNHKLCNNEIDYCYSNFLFIRKRRTISIIKHTSCKCISLK